MKIKFFILCDVIFLVRLQEKFELSTIRSQNNFRSPSIRSDDVRWLLFQTYPGLGQELEGRLSFLTLSLLRVINVKIPLQPHKKYDITQYGELDFS